MEKMKSMMLLVCCLSLVFLPGVVLASENMSGEMGEKQEEVIEEAEDAAEEAEDAAEEAEDAAEEAEDAELPDEEIDESGEVY